MATTTNYGWTTPDDTALVKDGAAAIRTLGSSIDTTTKNLNPETTLGDLAYRSSTANVKTRLALGTANQQLRVNSGATAPEWFTPAAAGGMTLLTTHTLSGSTSTISGISGSYKNLLLIIQGLSTGGADPNYKINPNGTSITSTAGSISTGDSATAFGSSSQLYLNFNESEGTNSNNAWALNIYNYANTTNYKPFSLSGYSLDDDAAHMATNIGGAIRTNSAITSLDFVTLAGSFSTGTVLIYGVN